MVLIPNALQPAQVDQVLLCDMIGRAIALVNEEHLSQAIGRYGQNVRLASKLCSWDIEIMTRDELNEQLDKSIEAFSAIPGTPQELAENLVEQGFFSFDDLSMIEPDQLEELGHPRVDRGPALPAAAEPVADIVPHRQVREERVGLEDDAEVALGGRQRGDLAPGLPDAPLALGVEARDGAQESGQIGRAHV
mgnify:CR=1 FL=1